MDQTQRLENLAISETGFLFDPYTGLTFSSNRTGKFILEQLRQGKPPAEIPEALRKQFELDDSDDPVRDVREFLILLRDTGLLPREEQT